jgi:2-amino-4-hydroxy-6-hydroxymethyldihydropteridine diphosphokinase
MAKAYLFTGSNVGNRIKNIENAARLISEQAGKIVKASSVYETQAWGSTSQGAFLNQALLIETKLEPKELLKKILGIEQQLGRVRLIKWEPRIIDIDILLYENIIYSDSDLVIPHPYLPERRFTLTPLVEIARNVIHPVLNKTMQELLTECKDKLEVQIYKPV